MNTQTSVFVALLAIATITSFIEGAPGDLGEPCFGYSCFGPFAMPKTYCSDKACPLGHCCLFAFCNGGLNCCKGSAPATAPPTTSSSTTTTTPAATPTTTTTGPTPAPP